MASHFRFLILDLRLLAAILLPLAGCAAKPPPANGPVRLSIEPWTGSNRIGQRIHTTHYTINTMVPDDEFNQRLANVMEGAWEQYRRMSGVTPPPGARAMDCYMFKTRTQWAQFTRKYAGDDADIYLKINRGGYTLADWFVAYYLGDQQTFSIAAHEGWHQYVARNFKGRLPPFLEEGIACMFESVSTVDSTPQWNWSSNPRRLSKLKQAVDRNGLWPLDQLMQMHAGLIVEERPERIEAFYAQNWAFARFLWEGENGRFRPALQRILQNVASGQGRAGWQPEAVRPMIENYLHAPLDEIERRYLQFVHQITAAEVSSGAAISPN